MNRIIYILPLAIVILLGGFIVFQNMTKITPDKKTENTKIPFEQLENVLITEKVADDLAKDTLTIPQDKWAEKLPALSQRVLKFFYDQGVIKTLPSEERQEEYQALLKAWGKPWRVHYLTTGFDKEELELIWDQLLLVQANTPEELEKQKQTVSQTLQKVEPSPELPEETDLSGHFKTQDDVNKAINEGKLIQVKTTNIKMPDQTFVVSPLAQTLKDLDLKLSSHEGVLAISSGTRFLKLQSLLKDKLGYLASKISYHTKGTAVDLKLTSEAKKRFDEYLKQQKANTSRLDQASLLNQRGVPLTVASLIKNNVLENDYEISQIYNILEQSLSGTGIEIIDETFFGVRLSKEGQVTEINPTFHLQYTQ